MSLIFIALGSNLGDRKDYLRKACEFLNEIGEIKKKSSIIETKAWGKENQPDFLNQVILLETNLTPEKLLEECQKIEQTLGRKRVEKWGKRTIDLDLLFYDDLVIKSEKLTIPHPYIAEREFVLKPLAEIAPEFVHPVLKKSINEMFSALSEIFIE